VTDMIGIINILFIYNFFYLFNIIDNILKKYKIIKLNDYFQNKI